MVRRRAACSISGGHAEHLPTVTNAPFTVPRGTAPFERTPKFSLSNWRTVDRRRSKSSVEVIAATGLVQGGQLRHVATNGVEVRGDGVIAFLQRFRHEIKQCGGGWPTSSCVVGTTKVEVSFPDVRAPGGRFRNG